MSRRKVIACRTLALGVALCAGAIAVSAAPVSNSVLRSDKLDIRVAPAEWGTARTADIEAVLRSTAAVLLPHFPRHASDRIEVRRGFAGPRVLAEKAVDGAYEVLLDVRDTRWDQLAYQFSHELCHIVTNFEHREVESTGSTRDHHWFEEALCESMSLLALERLASGWEQAPPHPAWRAYAPAFRRYALRLQAQAHRHLPARASFAEWYQGNRAALELNPYLRDRNEVVAGILLALLEETPGGLEATGYLNLQPAAGGASFMAYLERWRDCCPTGYEQIVARLMALVERADHPDIPLF